MTIQKLPGTAITPGTITVVQLESTVATTVSTGGGPKITNLAITSNVNVTLDDTAVDLTGGFIRLTGTGFNTGCLVYAGLLPAASTTFISNTEVRAQLSAQSAGTYPVYLVNPDGGTAIRVPGVTYSASPAWQTASSLGDQYDGVLLNLSVIATDAVTYTLVSGSLPPGLSLNSNTGVISGTITGVANDTVYTFTINAVDAQNQDSPRVFTINVTVSDPYFKLTTLLLTGNSGNTVVTDSSTNNFAVTVVGDSRASNFSPYLTGWSCYFDGSGDNLIVASNAAFALGSGDFTVECWFYMNNTSTAMCMFENRPTNTSSGINMFVNYSAAGQVQYRDSSGAPISSSITVSANTWNHYALVRSGSTITLWINGQSGGSVTKTTNFTDNTCVLAQDQGGGFNFAGYLSNFRIVKGTALYTANFTPATATLTSVAGTSLLTCHVNRFVDSSTNNFAITRNGDVRVTSFNPFNLTNTGTTGSMYFDGTGDYVLTSSTTAMNLGANPFCLEMWFYLNSTGSTYYGLCGSQTDYKGPSISRYSSVLMYGLSSNGSSWNVMGAEGTTGSTTINPYQWYHLVLCRTGNTISAYVNGLRDATVASSATLISRTEGFCIGHWYAGLYPWNGYISNVRFVVGSNPYDATQTTLTIPAAPLTTIANTSLLILQNRQPHNNHGFQDSSSNNFLITRSGNATQGTFSPFSQSGWSNYLGSVSDYLNVTSISLGSSFTIEFFVFFNSAPSSNNVILSNAAGGGGTNWIGITSTTVSFSYSGTTRTFSFTPSGGVWYYVQIINSASSLSCYVNGSQIGTTQTGPSSYSIDRIGGYSGVAFSGYLSNVRVNNTALAVSATPTSPLTDVANTVLLTCQANRFVDSNTQTTAKTITPSGSPSVQAWSPFAATATYSPLVHGGSAYADASGDYLSLPAGNPLLNTSAWTVECWIYPNSYINAQGIWGASNGGGAQQKVAYQVYGSAIALFIQGSVAISSTAPSLKCWTHVAVSRSSSGTGYIYYNGILQTSGAVGSSAVSNPFQWFTNGEGGTTGMEGYIANGRVSNVARYTGANFDCPTTHLTSDANTLLLCNFTNDAIEDATGRNVIETVGDARTTSVVTKWAGSHSMYFDGTGDYLAVPSSDFFKLFTDNFTIEAWIRFISVTNATFVTTNVTSGLYWQYYSSALAFGRAGGGTNINGSWSPSANIWYHVATVRIGNTITHYIDGLSVGSGSFTDNISASTTLQIGTGGAGSLNGYIQDLRLTRGYARYTANFTPPTAPARLK